MICGSAEEDRPKERLKDENGTGVKMMITVNLYYRGSNGNARAFAEEMEASGIAHSIRKEPGNLRKPFC